MALEDGPTERIYLYLKDVVPAVPGCRKVEPADAAE
jgi:hypothetical protein